MSIQPLTPNLPSSQRAFTNKYSTGSLAPQNQSAILTALSQLPLPRPATQANVINPLALYDATRANRGLSPLTPRQSAAALRTLATGKPATPPRRQGLFRSALGNLRQLVTSIPKLPMMLYDEAGQLLDLPQNVNRALAESDNPVNALGNLASVPGLRMLPGAFIAEQLAGDKGQGVQGLLANPLFTALDALPLASGLAKSTKVARAADAAYAGQVEALTAARVAKGYDASTAIIPDRPRPLQTALTRTLDPTGAVVPNALGRGIQSATNTFIGTNPGNLMQQTFRERITSRVMNRGTTNLREAADPSIPTSSLRTNVPGGVAAMAEEFGIRDLAVDAINQLTDDLARAGMAPEDFFTRATTSQLPNGTPMVPEQMLDLTPELRSRMREVRDFWNTTAAYTDALPGPNRTKTLLIDGTPEVFDLRTANRISKYQKMEANVREVVEAKAMAMADTPPNIADLDARIADVRARSARGELLNTQAEELIRLYEVAKLPANNAEVMRVVPILAPLKEYPPAIRLADAIKKGRWSDANKELSRIADTRYGRALPFDIADLKAAFTQLGKRDRAVALSAKTNDRLLAKATRVREKMELRHAPARFDELTDAAAREATESRVRTTFATDPDLDQLVYLANKGIFDSITTRDPRFLRYVREDQAAAKASWKALRDAGHDPIFMQRVTPKQAEVQRFIRLSDAPRTLQATKARMMDATPYVRDVGLVMNQAQLDILQRRATGAAMDDIATSFGRTRASLVEEYTPRLMVRADSATPARTRMDTMIRERWMPLSDVVSNMQQGRGSTFAVERSADIYIPRAMGQNLQRMFADDMPKLFTVLDPITKVFRTSVLPLAVRWQLNNLVGGAIVVAVNDPRAFLEMPRVIKQLWGERHVHPIAANRLMPEGAPPSGLGMNMSPEAPRWDIDAGSPMRDKVMASAQFASGTTLRKLFDAARESRLAKIPDAATRAVQSMYSYNQLVDDIVRASLNASQKKRLLGKGYSAGAADALAANSIRRFFQAWDDMTPMERSVMRSVVPFYGFAAYATKFALRYPFDHPFRASVLNSIAQAELDDAMTGLPEYIREMILLGDPRANGTVRALNVGPFNPFGGVPSMFTVAGFTGQLNPAITTVLESIGVDVARGGPQLYPELRYDPESGRLVADPSGNILSNLVGNTVPQLSGVTSLLGWNDKFNETMRRDPAAAGRMLLSNFGMPILMKNVNVGEQLIRSEMARFEDQETARKEALSTGNLGLLDDFPGLAAYGEQVRALDAAGMLDAIRKPTGVPGGDSKAGIAYATQAALTGS